MSNKNIIIYAPLALWHIHFATDLELAQVSLTEGYNVHWIYCNSDLKVCQSNPQGLKSRCKSCRHCFQLGMKWLRHNRLTILPLNNISLEQQQLLNEQTHQTPTTLDELKSIHIDNSDIGLAVLSSLVSHLREPTPDVSEHKKFINKSVYSALLVHYNLKNYIATIAPDKLYLFNGRYAELRPALRICQQKGIDVFTHDRAGIQGRYKLTPNNYPHAIEHVKNDIINHWERSCHTKNERFRISESWYRERIAGKDQAWFSFVKKQKKGRLPKQFDFKKNNIGIFISSEDEFVAIVEWKNKLYQNQNEGITKILQEYENTNNHSFHFYIRVHPNLAGLDNTQTKELLKIANKYKVATIIPPKSTIDTYALVESVDIVITFGTTVGIESANLGKESILIGRSFYEDLDVVIRPNTHTELVEFLNQFNKKTSPDNHHISKKGLAMYGYYQATTGKPYQYVVQKSVNQFCMVRDGTTYSVTLNRYKRIARFFFRLLNR